MVHNEVRDHPDPPLVGRLDERVGIADRPVVAVDGHEVGDVVAAVPQRRGVHRQQPDAVDAEPLEVVELLGQAAEVAGAVRVPVVEPAQVDLVEGGRLEPQRVALEPLARRLRFGDPADPPERALARRGHGRLRARGRRGRHQGTSASSR